LAGTLKSRNINHQLGAGAYPIGLELKWKYLKHGQKSCE
jgi:hypothetical protein